MKYTKLAWGRGRSLAGGDKAFVQHSKLRLKHHSHPLCALYSYLYPFIKSADCISSFPVSY